MCLSIKLSTYSKLNCLKSSSSSSSSCRIAGMDLPDPLTPAVSIFHRSREVFKPISCIGTELLYILSSWSSCLWSSMRRGLREHITYHKSVHAFPKVNMRKWLEFELSTKISQSNTLATGLSSSCNTYLGPSYLKVIREKNMKKEKHKNCKYMRTKKMWFPNL